MVTREDKVKLVALAICEKEYFGFDPLDIDPETGKPMFEDFLDTAEHVLNTLENGDLDDYLYTQGPADCTEV